MSIAVARQATAASTLFSPFSRTTTSVKQLLKDISTQLTVRDPSHTVTVTDLSALPSVIWNVFNVDATVLDTQPLLGTSTYAITGSYDVLTKQLTIVDRSLVDFTPLPGEDDRPVQAAAARLRGDAR